MNLGSALLSRGDVQTALSLYEGVLEIRRQLVSSGNESLRAHLASVEINMEYALMSLDDLDAAAAMAQSAREQLQAMVDQGESKHEVSIARADMLLGIVRRHQKQFQVSREAFERGRDRLRRLIEQGAIEFEEDLARVNLNMANTLRVEGNMVQARAIFEESRSIFSRLVADGRQELASELVRIDLNQASARIQQGDLLTAINMVIRAEGVLRDAIGSDECTELWLNLAHMNRKLGKALRDGGDLVRSIDSLTRSRMLFLERFEQRERQLLKDLCLALGMEVITRSEHSPSGRLRPCDLLHTIAQLAGDCLNELGARDIDPDNFLRAGYRDLAGVVDVTIKRSTGRGRTVRALEQSHRRLTRLLGLSGPAGR